MKIFYLLGAIIQIAVVIVSIIQLYKTHDINEFVIAMYALGATIYFFIEFFEELKIKIKYYD